MTKTHKNQNYASIKKECLSQGKLFEDPEFPANAKSLYHTKMEDDVEWLRPKEICRVPKLVVGGVSSDDLVCDDVSRSWFATACMALAREPKLWNKVVPDSAKQEWSETNPYAGVFRFSVWRFGEWIDVVIDDRLPTRQGQLVYCRSSSKNEFWSALLEKAYAKLFGDYELMSKGETGDAMEDFTGGVQEKISFSSLTYLDPTMKNAVFGKLKDAYENNALISCIIQSDPTLVGADGPDGLVNGLGYNITMVKEVAVKSSLQAKLGTNNLRLLRLFSPGVGSKWTGPWAVKSREMSQLSILDWEKMGIKYDKEEEFWISYYDFSKTFTDIYVCHFLNTSYFSLKKAWHETLLYSEWTHNGLDGGSDWDGDTVLRNPQFMFDVTMEKDTVVIGLEQQAALGDAQYNTVGFYIIKVEQNRKYRLHVKGELMFRSEFMSARSVMGRAELPKGRYVAVPCCQEKAATGSLMVRFYAASNPSCLELKKECPDVGCCRPKYKTVTTIEVEKVDGLALPTGEKGSLDPFITISCEGNKVTSAFKKNTGSPVFHTKATFYRKNPSNPIKVEVYNRNLLINSFLCEARVNIPATLETEGGEAGVSKVLDVYGRKKEAEVKKPGKVYVFIRSSHDLALL